MSKIYLWKSLDGPYEDCDEFGEPLGGYWINCMATEKPDTSSEWFEQEVFCVDFEVAYALKNSVAKSFPCYEMVFGESGEYEQ